jgi:hypothetical protein
MAFTTIPSTDVDAKSPVDDTLLGFIKADLDDLDSRVVTAGAKPTLWEVQGRLKYLSTWKRSIAAGFLNDASQPTLCRFMVKKSGISGTLAFDLRKHTNLAIPITEVAHQYTANNSSISRKGSALNTQSIARFTTQIATQSITHAKAAQNVQSIILLGTQYISEVSTLNLVQYNLDAAISADTLPGDGITIASCTTGANNGNFTIVEKNRGGGNNVVVANASGVAQTGVAGTVQEKIMSYNYSNPLSTTGFTAGYAHDFLSHTTGANNGDFTVYAINQSGNNAWVKNVNGVLQAGVAGTLDTNFWQFNLSSAASSTDYIVGETVTTASHSTGGNNSGTLPIIAVNSGGNNLILYNTAGATQGGVAGTINTNRWSYNLPTDPTSQVSVGHTINLEGCTSGGNNGLFTVVETSASALTVYNTAGVAQGGAGGTVFSTRKLIKFSSDQSANFTTLSFIEMKGLVSSVYNYDDATSSIAPYSVLEINRGGGANYNVVINAPNTPSSAPSQASPAGFVICEMKSIFSSAPSLAASLTSLEPNLNVVGSSTSFVTATIPANTPIMLYITSVMAGEPEDLTVTLL